MESEAKKIISEFSFLNSWEEKYEHLISMGQEMSKLDNSLKTENNLLRGCQSKVWIVSKYNVGKLYFYADSDALITKKTCFRLRQKQQGKGWQRHIHIEIQRMA